MLAEFRVRDIALEMAFPLVYSATTMAGLSALKAALPSEWQAAIALGRGTHPRPTPMSKLHELLERGSTRILPTGPDDNGLVTARRSALSHLHDSLPPARLGEIGNRELRRLIAGYRSDRADLSSTMISRHITELRQIIREARAEAGLPLLELPPRPPTRRQGRAAHRPMASLADVVRILRRSDRRMRVLIALMLAAPLLQTHALGLRRGQLDLDRGRLRIDTMNTRRPEAAEGYLVYGLPPWCVDLLRAELPGIDTWPPDQLLFPSAEASYRPLRTASALFRIAADAAGCVVTRLQDIRRLSQSIHATAPRAVRRGTATARRDVKHTLHGPAARALADAQEAHAAWVVTHWRRLLEPPITPTKAPSRRAPRDVQPHQPERAWSAKLAAIPPTGPLPESCLAAPDPAPVAASPDQGELSPWQPRIAMIAPIAPIAIGAGRPPPSQFGLGDVGSRQSVHPAARDTRNVTEREALVLAVTCAGSGFVGGMTVEAYLSDHPGAREAVLEFLRLHGAALAGAVSTGR